MKPLIAIYITLLSVSGFAQADILSKRVTFQYDNVRLREALASISDRYSVNFSYSSDYIPVRQKIKVFVENVPLSTGLDRLFENTQIIYTVVGSHIVLKIDPNKKPSKTETGKQSRLKKEPPELKDEQTAVLVKAEQPPEEKAPPVDSIITLQMPETQVSRAEGKMHPFDETLLNFEKWRLTADWTVKQPGEGKRLAQVSILPFIGTNTYNSNDLTNNVSMNILWGYNGGVDGLEVGGGLNVVKNDVKGFQIGGLGNRVGRNVTGTQVGGFFNYNDGTTKGFQVAGLANFSRQAEAAQAAGVINWVAGDISGMQASGLFNMAGGNSNAFQAAGAFNYTGGNAKIQIGGVFNRARDVDIAQVSMMNIAKNVKGFQIGLINISDTVSGVPIALINIVKRGYNKFEIYGSEALHGNLQLKLGANAFYNIFHAGARYPEGNGKYAWGMGYGIGTVSTLSKKTSLNFELMAIHISENEAWTNNLNSIGQFRFLWNHQLGKSISFFLGPTANVMISQLRNPETGILGSTVVPYTLIDKELNDRTSLKAWVGVNAGFRF